MSKHGWIALGLGTFFSLIIGCGLMALVFYSSRYGYDEAADEFSASRRERAKRMETRKIKPRYFHRGPEAAVDTSATTAVDETVSLAASRTPQHDALIVLIDT